VGREVGTSCGEVASISVSQVKAKELDSPLAWGAGVVVGAVPVVGAGASKGIGGGREEAKESRGTSGKGNEGLGVGGEVAVGVGVKGWAMVMGRGAKEEAASKRAKPAKMF
jgi:hypothetical protein